MCQNVHWGLLAEFSNRITANFFRMKWKLRQQYFCKTLIHTATLYMIYIWYYIWYIWHDMTWRDVTWHDLTWHDVTWRDVTWRDVTWRGVICDMIYICLPRFGWHPVAVVQYTFTQSVHRTTHFTN